MGVIKAYAIVNQNQPLEAFEYETKDLGAEEVEIKVHYCGICHSDLSMIENEWQITKYPLVAGHEIAGEIVSVGSAVSHLKIGDRVGLGWVCKSCMICNTCLAGDHNLCALKKETIVGRHGGFADRVRAHCNWVIPIPEKLDLKYVGPLFCGGVTVFNPILRCGVKPTDRVGVLGIGGLGHMALKFLSNWGCHVTAFSSTFEKSQQAMGFGACDVVNSHDEKAIESKANTLDFLLVTVNVPLNWQLYLKTLKPKGRLHFVGAVLEPLKIGAFDLITSDRSVSGSPVGSILTIKNMLEFSERHAIFPQIEVFPMSKVNDAFEHLKSGKARYRIVLENDF